jgi:hypothetical protein
LRYSRLLSDSGRLRDLATLNEMREEQNEHRKYLKERYENSGLFSCVYGCLFHELISTANHVTRRVKRLLYARLNSLPRNRPLKKLYEILSTTENSCGLSRGEKLLFVVRN